jgi:hypothetical protein
MLDPPDASSNQCGVPLLDEDYLILSTIHSSAMKRLRIARAARPVKARVSSVASSVAARS